MAKLGLLLLSPAAGLRAVLSLTPETKYASNSTQSNIWGYSQVFQPKSQRQRFFAKLKLSDNTELMKTGIKY